MDMANQAKIKEMAEKYGKENILAILGGAEAESVGLTAETIISGDPTFAGPLSDIALGLEVYHIFELKEVVDPQMYEEQISMMEMVLNEAEIISEISKVRNESHVMI